MIKPRAMPDLHEGEVYTIDEFRAAITAGVINSDDGSGYYGNDQFYDLTASVWRGIEPHGATHVAWFSK